MKPITHCFISVGELSGDILAAELVYELKRLNPEMQFSGIVGPSLIAAGVTPVGTIEELNVMGIFEVARSIAPIRMLQNRILNYIETNSVEAALLIDSAGFHLPLAEDLKMRGLKIIQYVAPKLWAWGEHRIARIKRDIDLLLATLPFEEEFFNKRGVNCHYVGCPIADRVDKISVNKEALGFSNSKFLVAMLPGSRPQEVRRLLPLMFQVAKKIKKSAHDIEFVIPLAPSLKEPSFLKWIKGFEQKGFQFWDNTSLELMSAADCAMVTSGTATLECALLMTPLVVLYSMNPFSYYIVKKRVRIPWISLVNILEQKFVVKEYVQNFSLDDVSHEMLSLLKDREKRDGLIEEFKKIKKHLNTKQSNMSAVQHIQVLLGLSQAHAQQPS